MRVFIDLDTLSNGYIPFLSWLARIRGKIEKREENLSVFPYNSMVIYLLNNNYKNNEIYLYVPKDKSELYENLALIVQKDLEQNGFQCFITSDLLLDDYIYIGDNILKFNLFMKSKQSHFVGDIFQYIFAITIYGSSKNCLSFFKGFFSIFFIDIFINLFWSILMIWPILFEIHTINSDRMMYIFIIGFLMMQLSSLIRTLLELNNERKYFMENKELLCGSEFILGTSSIVCGFFWCIVYFICILSFGIFNPMALFYGLIMFGLNFVFYLSPTNLRSIFFITTMFLLQLLLNPVFALKFIRLQ